MKQKKNRTTTTTIAQESDKKNQLIKQEQIVECKKNVIHQTIAHRFLKSYRDDKQLKREAQKICNVTPEF